MNLEETMPLVFERSIPGRIGFSLPESDVPETNAGDYLIKHIFVLYQQICQN